MTAAGCTPSLTGARLWSEFFAAPKVAACGAGAGPVPLPGWGGGGGGTLPAA